MTSLKTGTRYHVTLKGNGLQRDFNFNDVKAGKTLRHCGQRQMFKFLIGLDRR